MAMAHTNEWSVPPLECRPLATRMRWCSISQQLRYKFDWELAFLPLQVRVPVFLVEAQAESVVKQNLPEVCVTVRKRVPSK